MRAAMLLAIVTAVLPAADKIIPLKQDTPVELRLRKSLSSADSRSGERVEFEVTEEVRLGGETLISAGAKAYGIVAEVTPRGRMARNGKLDLRVENVCLADGSIASIRALREADRAHWHNMQSETSVVEALMAIPAVPMLLFVQGKDITIPKGRELTAYIAEDAAVNATRVHDSGAQRNCMAAVSNGGSSEPTANPINSQLSVVNVTSDPVGADIHIGGRFVGSTPSSLRLPTGEHRLFITKSGRKPYERSIWVTPGGEVNVNAFLEDASRIRKVGSFADASNGSGSKVQ